MKQLLFVMILLIVGCTSRSGQQAKKIALDKELEELSVGELSIDISAQVNTDEVMFYFIDDEFTIQAELVPNDVIYTLVANGKDSKIQIYHSTFTYAVSADSDEEILKYLTEHLLQRYYQRYPKPFKFKN